ncbi:DUF5675 family protein [Flavobacterium sp. WC2509]|uniref:DUF5675 family protein n=1 Tax=Flavobacterium sp. WC2509 TaxID=3461406 RepID=UPI004043B1C5
MDIVLTRTYFSDGTNGKIECEGRFVCYTIELPWLDNAKQISCIPEGKYLLRRRYSPKFQWHVEVADVANRSSILLHPANNAQKELKGCIAPVTKVSGAGLGLQSRQAFLKVKCLVYSALERNETVLLIVQS